MQKIYIVRLSEDERNTCHEIIKKLKGSSQKVRRAHMLLKADADGPNWKDQDIADAFLCTIQSVQNVRKRLITEGFDIALNGKKEKLLLDKKYWTENKKHRLLRYDYPIRRKDGAHGLFDFLHKKSSNWRLLQRLVTSRFKRL